MKKTLNNKWKEAKKEVLDHKIVYLALFSFLFLSFFLRVYRIDQLLGFYFDQGRDAQVIWDFWHNSKLFLIGPTTGIEGIFRGPWYYWLIAPFYYLGGGNPVWPSIFLSFTTVAASFFVFLIAKRVGGVSTGIIAVILASFSYNLMYASRWLSNPTPMFLVSTLFIYSLFRIIEGGKNWWVAVGFLLGLAMQFGSAAEVFYFLGVIIFSIWQRKYLPSPKIGLLAIASLFLIFLPQIYFDFKHDHVLFNSINKFLISEKSFKLSFWEVVKARIPFYYGVFFSKIFATSALWRYYFALILAFFTLLTFKKLMKNTYFLILALFLFCPMAGMLFFQGNQGNVYDYYFTGYYLIFILLVASVLGMIARSKIGFIVVFLIIFWFLRDNIPISVSYISAGVDGETHITLGNELQAVNWIFEDNGAWEFNVDTYVPPVISHSYNYLFLWQAYSKCGQSLCNLKLDSQTPLLYTLYEVDPPHPERLEAWLARQEGIGIVEKSVQYGGITVEKRTRIK